MSKASPSERYLDDVAFAAVNLALTLTDSEVDASNILTKVEQRKETKWKHRKHLMWKAAMCIRAAAKLRFDATPEEAASVGTLPTPTTTEHDDTILSIGKEVTERAWEMPMNRARLVLKGRSDGSFGKRYRYLVKQAALRIRAIAILVRAV